MELIDKGTHLSDAAGNNYAKTQSHDPGKKHKKRLRIRPADTDILFGLYLEKAQGRLTLDEIASATGFKKENIVRHASAHGFTKKIAAVLSKSKVSTALSSETVATNLAGRLLAGAEEHQVSIDELMEKTRKHFKRMKGGGILKQAKEIKTIDDIGRRLYKLDTEEKTAASTQVLNVAFLMAEGMRTVTSQPAT